MQKLLEKLINLPEMHYQPSSSKAVIFFSFLLKKNCQYNLFLATNGILIFTTLAHGLNQERFP